MSNALDLLRKRRDELAAIDESFDNWSVVETWCARTRPLIATGFPAHVDAFDRLSQPEWEFLPISILGNDSLAESFEQVRNAQIAHATKNKLLAHVDAIIEQSEQCPTTAALGDAVFLVHGRNERWLHEVARFLERLGLTVEILRENSNRGRTLIEKFEDVAGNAGFAVVLLTGDDLGGLATDPPEEYKPRARQNVILELGFFLGKLERSRVCALHESGVEIPSDFNGVAFVPLDASGTWRVELAKEIRDAGFAIDLNRAL